jgi:predicted porin
LAGLNGNYYNNQSGDDAYSSGIDRQTKTIAPYIQYRIRDWMTVSTTYRHTRIENSAKQKPTENNAVWILLTLQHDLFES